ncbi:MAG: hypothetical protein FWF07_01300 [Methanomassiliicoccaceae archaeon]|nr:hypothetical protein [Methanomassiliicoccaceae archaeon]
MDERQYPKKAKKAIMYNTVTVIKIVAMSDTRFASAKYIFFPKTVITSESVTSNVKMRAKTTPKKAIDAVIIVINKKAVRPYDISLSLVVTFTAI